MQTEQPSTWTEDRLRSEFAQAQTRFALVPAQKQEEQEGAYVNMVTIQRIAKSRGLKLEMQ